MPPTVYIRNVYVHSCSSFGDLSFQQIDQIIIVKTNAGLCVRRRRKLTL